jgi:hypothetical protein
LGVTTEAPDASAAASDGDDILEIETVLAPARRCRLESKMKL